MEKLFKLICLTFVFHILATHSYAATVVKGATYISPGLTGDIIDDDALGKAVIMKKLEQHKNKKNTLGKQDKSKKEQKIK